ncbi:MAG: hypothetical protein AB8B36_02070 [Prochlorococcus sp.]
MTKQGLHELAQLHEELSVQEGSSSSNKQHVLHSSMSLGFVKPSQVIGFASPEPLSVSLGAGSAKNLDRI